MVLVVQFFPLLSSTFMVSLLGREIYLRHQAWDRRKSKKPFSFFRERKGKTKVTLNITHRLKDRRSLGVFGTSINNSFVSAFSVSTDVYRFFSLLFFPKSVRPSKYILLVSCGYFFHLLFRPFFSFYSHYSTLSFAPFLRSICT